VATGVYNYAEQYTVVKTAIDLSQPIVKVAEPVVHRVVAAADPWVDSVDHVVTGAAQTVNARVIDPARDDEGHITVSGMYSSVKQVTTEELRHGYDVVVGLSDHAVDYILPESHKQADSNIEEKDIEHAKSLLEVGSKAQRRVLEKLGYQWNDARAFSSGTLKQVIHVDLLETAANGYTYSLALVQNNVVPVVTGVTASAQSAYVSVRDVSAERSKLLWDSVRAQSQGVYKYTADKADGVYKFAADKAEAYRVPEIVGKARDVSFGELSEFVLVNLKIKGQNEQFLIAQNKLYDLFKTVIGVNLSTEESAKPAADPKSPEKSPASRPKAHPLRPVPEPTASPRP